VALFLLVSGVHAADQCVDTNNLWSCFGVLEVRTPNAPPGNVARMIRYANGEIMFEIEKDGRVARALLIPKADAQFFFGLQNGAGIEPNRNPFAFIDQTFGVVVRNLHSAFPLGPKAATEAPRESNAAAPGDASFAVTIQRIDSQSIRYTLTPIEHDGEITGIIRLKLFASLPNSFSLREWLSDTQFDKLGDVRSRRLPKHPVLLQ